MRLCQIFCCVLLSACSKERIVLRGPDVPPELRWPCAVPNKTSNATEGAFVALAFGWKATALCNADKLDAIDEILELANKTK